MSCGSGSLISDIITHQTPSISLDGLSLTVINQHKENYEYHPKFDSNDTLSEVAVHGSVVYLAGQVPDDDSL